MFKDLYDSLVRTFVPVIVGSVVGWVAVSGVPLDAGVEVGVTTVVTALATGLYYVVARLLETYVAPRFGWLLGKPVAPVYVSEEVASGYVGRHSGVASFEEVGD